MKYIFLFACIMTGYITTAQQTDQDYFQKQLMNKYRSSLERSNSVLIKTTGSLAQNSLVSSETETVATFLNILPNGNKLYSLPQDNMPCIVPMNESNMPIAGIASVVPGGLPGSIPNAGLRDTPLIPRPNK